MYLVNTRTTRQFLSTAEAAKLAGVCQVTVRRWIASGRVVATRPSGLREYLVDARSLPQPRGLAQPGGQPQ